MTSPLIQGEVIEYYSESSYGFAKWSDNDPIRIEKPNFIDKDWTPKRGDRITFKLKDKRLFSNERYAQPEAYDIRFVPPINKISVVKPTPGPAKKSTRVQNSSTQQLTSKKDKIIHTKSDSSSTTLPPRSKQRSSQKGTNKSREFHRRAKINRAEGRKDIARKWFRQAIESGAAPEIYEDFIGFLLTEMTSKAAKQEARSILTKVIKKFPNHANFYKQFADLEQQNKNKQEAIKFLQRGYARTSDPNLLKELNYLADLGKPQKIDNIQEKPQRQTQLQRQVVKLKVNPYVVGKQVTGDKFIGRQDILADLITALKAGNHLIIEGERRIGKTSILYKLAELLRQDKDYWFIPAYVQLQQVEETELFYAMMRAVARESRRRYDQMPALQCEATYNDYSSYQAEDDLLIIVDTFRKITPLPVRVVILLDEGDRLRDFTEKAHRHLRGWMGSEVPNEVLLLVWCGVSFDKTWHQDTSPWYNQFRNALEIPPLSPSEAKSLITQPVQGYYQYEDQAIEQILELSQRKPFVIQLICDECIKRNWQQGNGMLITLADVQAVWPQVQARLSSDEQAQASSEANTNSIIYEPTLTPQEVAESPARYSTATEEKPDES